MKIQDLSIGDWVALNGIPRKIFKISATGLVKFYNLANSYGIGGIEPIPITTEILERNGWSRDGMYAILRLDEHTHLEYYYHEHRLRKWYCGVDEWQNHTKVNDITFQVHCYSVHQLQYALRLAGIDKEITL